MAMGGGALAPVAGGNVEQLTVDKTADSIEGSGTSRSQESEKVMMNWYQAHTETVQGFEVVLSVCTDSSDPAESFDDDGETARLIRSGVYEWFIARVEARCEGVTLAADYLGGCCYRNFEEFRTEPGGYYADMVRTVLDEARLRIARLAAHCVDTCPHCGRDLEGPELAAGLCTSDDCPRHDPPRARGEAAACA